MNILHVCSNYFPAHGGPQYTLKNLSEKLIQYYDDNVEVATSNSLYGPEMTIYKMIEPAVETINHVEVNRFAFRRWHYPLLTFANKVSGKLRKKALPYSIMKHRWALDCAGIDNMMKDTSADVIMAATIHYNFCDYPMWRFKTANPKPFVLYGSLHLNIHLTDDSPFIKRAKACDCYIANTNFEERELLKFGVDKNKIVTIGTGIEIADYHCKPTDVKAFRAKYEIKEDEIFIGHIGRLSQNKGTEVLLNAFRKIYLTNKKVKLLLAGTYTDYVPELKRIIEEEKLPVVLIENFDIDLKPVLFHALDIFVLASRGESFGVVFLEAWVCGKPAIGANTGAVSELLNDGKDSYLFENGNAESLAEKLKLLIDNVDTRNVFGKNGFEKVYKNFTWPTIVAKYKEAYQKGIENFNNQNNN